MFYSWILQTLYSIRTKKRGRKMKLNYVIIYVDDVVKATDFYAKAFGLPLKFIHESMMYAEMDTGETILSFAHNDMLTMNIGVEAHKGQKNCFEIAF